MSVSRISNGNRVVSDIGSPFNGMGRGRICAACQLSVTAGNDMKGSFWGKCLLLVMSVAINTYSNHTTRGVFSVDRPHRWCILPSC